MNIDAYRPTERFAAKARYYDFRPDYPAELIEVLRKGIGLSTGWVVADIGAGTGKLTKPFLDNGNRVFALEPNAAMLAVLRKNIPAQDTLTALQWPAEATGLEDGSVDLIAVGQAFHWFDVEKVRIEFKRILKSPGRLLLASNGPEFVDKRLAGRVKAITEKYYYKHEENIDYGKIDHRALFTDFQAYDITLRRTLRQKPDDVFKGILSSSFCPDEGDPGFADMKREFMAALAEHSVDDLVESRIETRLTYGRVK